MSGAKLRLPSTRLQYEGMDNSNFTFYKRVVAYGFFTSNFTLEHTQVQSGSRGIAPKLIAEYAAISCVMLFRLSAVSTCLNLLYHFPPSLQLSAFTFLNYRDTGRLK